MGSILASFFNRIIDPGLHFVGILLKDITSAIVLLVVALLQKTVLHPDSFNGIWWVLLNNGYLVLAGFSAAIVLASIMWEALQIQQRQIFSVGPDDSYANLLGRAIWAMVMIASGPILLRILIGLNNTLVTAFSQMTIGALLQSFQLKSLGTAFYNMNSFKAMGFTSQQVHAYTGSLLSVGILGVLEYFFLPVIGLVVALLMLWSILMWFARQFELVFWGALMSVSLALSVSDPQRKLWEFVKVQLQGLIFQQAIMAFVIWLTISIRVAVIDHGGYNVLNDLFGNIFTAVGLYYAFKAPKYWQQAHGHVSGGNEIAQFAAGSMLGRLGSNVLMASRAGVAMEAATQHMTEHSQKTLRSNAQEPNQMSDAVQEVVGDPLRKTFDDSAMGQHFNDWMERGTHDIHDDAFWEPEDGEDPQMPSWAHRAAAKVMRGTGKTASYASRLGVDMVFNPFSAMSHRIAQGTQYNRQRASELHEENRANTIADEAGTDIPDRRLQNDALAAEVQLQAMEDNPEAVRAIQRARNYQPPDSPTMPSPSSGPGPSGRSPSGSSPSSGGAARPSTSSSTDRAWHTDTKSGLLLPDLSHQVADPTKPDLLVDTEGNLLRPDYNDGDPGNSIAVAEAWKAQQAQKRADRAIELASTQQAQRVEDSRPDPEFDGTLFDTPPTPKPETSGEDQNGFDF